MKIEKTNRGFEYIEWKDRYKLKCSLQKSSLATENTIWFGVNDANPQIMVKDAKKLGIINISKENGWISYNIPEEVVLSTRMHLTQKMVKELLPYLQKFVETGEIN